ncbi:kinesin-related protein 4-like [Procambarus clarkii]|uniref:kinesin-related protein 4-like n=1 Tax=Procambarus clarkii TaxID=6728 RepID=UPI003742EF01
MATAITTTGNQGKIITALTNKVTNQEEQIKKLVKENEVWKVKSGDFEEINKKIDSYSEQLQGTLKANIELGKDLQLEISLMTHIQEVNKELEKYKEEIKEMYAQVVKEKETIKEVCLEVKTRNDKQEADLRNTEDLVDLKPEDKVTKMIVQHFPVEVNANRLLECPNVTTAERYQRIGHHKDGCRDPERCGVYSELHNTDKKLHKEGKPTNVDEVEVKGDKTELFQHPMTVSNPTKKTQAVGEISTLEATMDSVDSTLNRIMDNLKIIQWNIQGIKNKAQTLRAVLIRDNIDIVLLQETLTRTERSINISRYRGYHCPIAQGGTRGISILVRNRINATVITDLPDCGEDVEIMEVNLTMRNSMLSIFNVYRSHTEHHMDISAIFETADIIYYLPHLLSSRVTSTLFKIVN